MEDILINITPQETRVAVIADGSVQELHVERAATLGMVGNIYVGKVARVLPGMQSAFVDIGLERAAFLHVADLIEHKQHAHGEHRNGERPAPIERMLREGDRLLVQVIKDPIGTKGARLSTQISLAGRMLVYLPQDPHIGISQKIEDEADRAHLRDLVARLVPAEETGGFIVRTSAEDAAEEEIAADIAYLRLRWSQIRDIADRVPPPSMLYQELSLAQRVLRDVVNEHTASIQIDSRENFVALQEFATQYVPGARSRLALYAGERPMFDLYQIDAEIEKALARRVDLKSGGYLIIDQTEAMTTVDVNTGGFVGTRSFDDTIYKTNLEAAQAIARQLRLRNLGGIIVVDFIDMASSPHRDAVMAEFKKALARDRTRITVNGFTQLGLVEMTRKRTRESLAHVLCEPCPMCGGRGEVKTARTICYEILREILRESRQFGATASVGAAGATPATVREFRILAAQAVVDLFLEEESQSLAQLSDFIGKPISMQVESVYHQEQYDIVLM
jgi:ribonuclease G